MLFECCLNAVGMLVLSRTLKGSTMEWQTCKRKLDRQRSVTAIENALRGGLASLYKWCR